MNAIELASWSPLPGAAAWTIDFDFMGTPSRSVALRLPSEGWLVFNPGKGVPGSAISELAERGPVEALFSPNHFHHMGVEPWRGVLGEVPLYASSQAAPRLEKKFGLGTRPLDELRPQLPEGVELLSPDGAKAGESWLAWGGGAERTWVVGDAFFNFDKLPFSPAGLLLRTTGGGPGLTISRVYRMIGVDSRPAYRAWLEEELRSAPPGRLVPSHGSITSRADLVAGLTKLIEKRF